jgi:hypothetical protein
MSHHSFAAMITADAEQSLAIGRGTSSRNEEMMPEDKQHGRNQELTHQSVTRATFL